MYIIIMMSGNQYKVTESEYQTIIKSQGDNFLPRLKVFINKSSISDAYPESISDQIHDRKNQQTGVLHDGTRVRKHFGQWVDAENMAVDDKGNYSPVRLDPIYYPEVSRDCVPTEQEFDRIKHLPTAERLQNILNGTVEVRKINGEMSGISGILAEQNKNKLSTV